MTMAIKSTSKPLTEIVHVDGFAPLFEAGEEIRISVRAIPRTKLHSRQARVRDVADAVLYLAQADEVTGEIVHADGGAHAGRW